MRSEIIPPPTDNVRTIFVDSDIDTHLAMVVSLYDTITDVKAKIAVEHALCFQDIGEIDIRAIKVRRRGFFYNLADSMYVLNAFDGVQGSWFVCIDVTPICTVKNQKVLPNKVTDEHLKHHDYVVPACNVDKHKEIVFCGLSSKNPGPDGKESHNPSIDREHRLTLLIDQENDDRREDDRKNLGIEASDVITSDTCTHKTIGIEASDVITSDTCTHKTIPSKGSKTLQQDKLLESQSQHYLVEKKRSRKLKDGLHEEHLEVCRRGSKFSGSEDIDESNKTANVPQEIHCDGKKENFASLSEGLPSKLPYENAKSLQKSPVKKHSKKRKSKSSKFHEVAHVAMPSDTVLVRSPQVTTDPQNSGKEANASTFSEKYPAEPNIDKPLPNDERDRNAAHDTACFLEVANQKKTRQEVNGETIEEQILQVNPEDGSEEDVNLSQYSNVIVSLKEPAEHKVSSQVVSEFPTKLYCNTEGLPSKLPHENTISFQNPLVEKHSKKRKRKSSKSQEEAHLVMPHGTVVVRSPHLTADSHNAGKVTNASIFSGKYPDEPSIEKSLEKDERDMSTSHDTASLLEVSNQKKRGHSMEIYKENILQVYPEDQNEKLVNSNQDTNVDVSLKEPAEARISSQVASESPTKLYCSKDKFKSQSSKILEPKETNDRKSSGSDATKCIRDFNLGEDGYVDAKAGISAFAEKFSYQEQATNEVSNLKGANKDFFSTKVDSKGLRKSQRIKKKSKAESSRVCESTELNGKNYHFNSDNAQVSLNDAQNESNAAKVIKQADQKANGGHHVEDAVVKISSSSKEVPNQDEISNNMNSGNPPISMPNNLSEVSNALVEQAKVRSPTSSEVRSKPRLSRKKSKNEPSKLGSQENCDVLLPKFNGEVTKSNEEKGSDPSNLDNESDLKIELQCMNARVKLPLSDENLSKLVKVPQVNPFESSTCKLQDSSEQSNAEIIIKGHVTQYEAVSGPTKSKCDRKKSKKETLKAQVSSEMNEPMGLCRSEDSSIKFDDSFVPREGKHSPAVHAADPPSGKSESRKKNKASRKTDISQPYQDSPTNLAQPSSYKQHIAIGQPLENDTNNDKGDVVHDTGTKESMTGTVRKAKTTKQSTEQNSSFGRIESDSSLHKARDKHKLDKKLQNYEPESHVRLSKSGAMGNKQGKKITADEKIKTRSLAPDDDIDNIVSKDGLCYKDHNSSTISQVMATEVASSDSTEDTSYQKKRFRVVKKVPSRKSKKITNNSNPEKSLMVSSGRIFSDASVTSSESENEPCKRKAAIKTALDDLSISGYSESHPEEVQTKAGALKLRMDTNSFGAESDERGEISIEADDRTNNPGRSDASEKKLPLSFILKSSFSYKKSKLTASQSEFADAENQPIDVVLETQPESAAP